MTRPLRIEFAGAVYHITSRGNAKQAIFLHEKDFANFLSDITRPAPKYIPGKLKKEKLVLDWWKKQQASGRNGVYN